MVRGIFKWTRKPCLEITHSWPALIYLRWSWEGCVKVQFSIQVHPWISKEIEAWIWSYPLPPRKLASGELQMLGACSWWFVWFGRAAQSFTGGFIIARGFITAVGRLGVLLLRWFGAAQEHAAFKFQLAPLKFAGAARRQGGGLVPTGLIIRSCS